MNLPMTTRLHIRVALTTLLATLVVNGYAVTHCTGATPAESAGLQWRRGLMTHSTDADARSARPSPQAVRWSMQPRFVDDQQPVVPRSFVSEVGQKDEASEVGASRTVAEPNRFAVPVTVNQIARSATSQMAPGRDQRDVEQSVRKPLSQPSVDQLSASYDPFEKRRQVDTRGQRPGAGQVEIPEPVAGGQVVFRSDRAVDKQDANSETNHAVNIQASLNQYALNDGEEGLAPEEYPANFNLSGPGCGCLECSCGVSSYCDSDWCDGGDCCGRRTWRDWYWGHFPDTRELILFGGVQAFKGPLDRNRDSGNFGFHEGFNWSAKLPWWVSSRIGYQIGYQAVHSQLHGSESGDTSSAHTQSFVTAGLFRRPECAGLQYGVVWDALRDDRDTSLDYHQVRSEIGLVNQFGREIGFQATVHTNESSSTAIPYHALDQFFFYYRIHRQEGGELRLFGGWTQQDKGIVGGDGIVPLSDRWSLASQFRYVIPGADDSSSAAEQEHWNLSMNLVWHLGRRARACDANRYRPLFNVANNGSLMVDDRP